MDKNKVLIFDTTLRDGEQALQSSLSVNEKIQIAQQLTRLKVDIIEAGFAISSPGDFQSIKTIAEEVKGPVICSLARCVDKDIEAAAKAVKPAGRGRVHVFIGTSRIHREKKLRKGDDEVLAMGVAAVKYARKLCGDVEFSCEDTGRTELSYLYRFVEAVIKAGAATINLPDTVGYTVPMEFRGIISSVFANVPNIDKAIISVHCHNDLGLAVANSIMAVECGVRQVECTINGIGERAGNCSLEEVVMILKTREKLLKLNTNIAAKEIMRTSRLVSRLCNMPVQPNKAIVGSNAFAHSSGIHQDGVLKEQTTYEIMKPGSIGLSENVLNLTSRSGRHVIKHRLALLGYKEKEYDLDTVYQRFLALADKKGRVYDDDLEALIELPHAEETDTFRLTYLNVTSGSKVVPTATLRISAKGKTIQEAATGDGPVHAVCSAIDRASGMNVKMLDYRITSRTGGREALGVVDILAEYADHRIHGSGSSTDIIEASALAYINILNKIVRLQEVRKARASRKQRQRKA
ncbi:MAG: 2-isopropylmalate synthase [Candidatus Raymondbacteria bacterium RifOxyA12_full_50_37]|uniref:2-isopropylmalate synthase n=1 Tax=Candidatus Raymondbacteria bacterium RIFOXYD12_FULL_49_13 TaxID=1817890 RepID=A0A1F7F4U4_UNCRA|nr:MAG: 2-isopropylmalate synthase [Candidatus Raymondbacteria bacterium RifOxyA12_full_50_37]OGJ91870.1 MAG: 2-isopropylmalate synthase [Candidatus Raymondbacteria bacterium RIFOXYA2_FULL_49_16]OGJ98092.1 MAG: 2-isopropylmalate synthase [Candidatus Raymondbacteria bacterium RIFOXYC2_FULL_50_21]OGK01680.1 MAG: 2-isopropylmalate synthase [Candidatus Raymondbacteria bacterium RIFOXYD12_FULL_49_13]OGK02323.1 MAG: 2-isopropylmalate synthase [Candidatus Raymondbacteria bacterium RifOxyB12_full_50_8]